jgi:hypothetical protein
MFTFDLKGADGNPLSLSNLTTSERFRFQVPYPQGGARNGAAPALPNPGCRSTCKGD